MTLAQLGFLFCVIVFVACIAAGLFLELRDARRRRPRVRAPHSPRWCGPTCGVCHPQRDRSAA
jgi:hypothetical protein